MKNVCRLLLIGLIMLGGYMLCCPPDTIAQSHAGTTAFTRSDVMFPGNEALVEKTVVWTCRTAGELTPPQLNVAYYLGAEVHYGHPWSIRNKPWKRMPDGRDNTRNVNLRISLVPYIESEQGQRYYLVPAPTSATFHTYALACASSDETTLMRAYPDLYPSLGLKAEFDKKPPDGEIPRISQRLIDYITLQAATKNAPDVLPEHVTIPVMFRQHRGRVTAVVTSSSVELNSLYDVMAEILKPEYLTFLNGWTHPIGFREFTSTLDQAGGSLFSSNDITIVYEPADQPPQPRATATTSVQIEVPRELEPAHLSMELLYCDSAKIVCRPVCEPPQKDSRNWRLYSARCVTRDLAPNVVRIQGFADVQMFSDPRTSTEPISLSPAELKAVFPISVPQGADIGYTYTGADSGPAPHQNIVALKVSVSALPAKIAFKVNRLPEPVCDFDVTFTLEHALQLAAAPPDSPQSILQLQPPCVLTTITWPADWMSISLPDPTDCFDGALSPPQGTHDPQRLSTRCVRPRGKNLQLTWVSGCSIEISATVLNTNPLSPYDVTKANASCKPMPPMTPSVPPMTPSVPPMTPSVPLVSTPVQPTAMPVQPTAMPVQPTAMPVQPTATPSPIRVTEVVLRLTLPDELDTLPLIQNDISVSPGCQPVACTAKQCETTCSTDTPKKTVQIRDWAPYLLPTLSTTEAVQSVLLDPDMLKVAVHLRTPPHIAYSFAQQGGGAYQVKTPFDRIAIPFSRLRESPSVDFLVAGDTTGACTVTHTFTFQQAWRSSQANPIDPGAQCQQNTMIWNKAWPDPVLTDPDVCLTFQKGEHQWMCLRRNNTTVELSWGDGWEPVTIAPTDWNPASGTYQVTLAVMVPKWPFREDEPWLQKDFFASVDDPCKAGPWYIPSGITYCGEKKDCNRSCGNGECVYADKGATLTEEDHNKKQRLPSLADVSWQNNDPLPQFAKVYLKKMSSNPGHAEGLAVPWNVATGQHQTLETLYGGSVPPSLSQSVVPVRVEPQEVPFDPSADFVVFESREACEAANVQTIQRADHPDYTAFETEQVPVSPCQPWALVVKNGRRKSECVEAERQNGILVFRMKSNEFGGERKLVVVTNSSELGASWRGKAIKEGLFRWMEELQATRKEEPFNFFVVEDNNVVTEVLRGEDLSGLALESASSPSIWGKINTLRFDAKGFQPFINIADVGTLTLDEHKEKNIDWVLFFTDSLFVPSPSSLDPKEYGTLLDWWKEDIKIGIVTISESDCNKWQATEVVQCQALGESPDATTIKNMLSNFSQYFGRK